MHTRIDPELTESDKIVLNNLFKDIRRRDKTSKDNAKDAKAGVTIAEKEVTGSGSDTDCSIKSRDENDIARLKARNNVQSKEFEPTIFTTWDFADLNPIFATYIIAPWSGLAQRIVRHPTDVVFLNHVLLYLCTIVPSAVYLFRHFTWTHGILHTFFTMWCAGPFTLMLHNHIHNGGILRKDSTVCRLLDWSFPYVLEPVMGHTWDSYFYHHVKHHHVEGNGIALCKFLHDLDTNQMHFQALTTSLQRYVTSETMRGTSLATSAASSYSSGLSCRSIFSVRTSLVSPSEHFCQR